MATLGRVEGATAAKAAFVGQARRAVGRAVAQSGRDCARTMERHLLIEAFRQLERPVGAPPEQRATLTTLLPRVHAT
jgi:hypothetical protein